MGRWIVGAAAACCALIAGLTMGTAGAGAAEVPITSLVAQPIAADGTCSPTSPSAADAPAGAHRDFCVAFALNTAGDDVKRVTIGLPGGVVGDPTATPTCTQSDFTAGRCDGSTQVGTVSSSATVVPPIPIPITLTITGEVYNLQTDPGEPARLGIALDQGLGGSLSPVRLMSPIRVRVADAGLDSVTDGIPDSALGGDLHVNDMALTLWGTKVHHSTMAKPFMTLPTRCDADAVSTISVTSYGGQTTSKTAAFRPTGCDQVPFTPSLEVGPPTTPADSPGEAWAKLIIPTTDTGSGDDARRQAYLKDVDLKLPAGLALNPPLANGLEPCTAEQFGFGIDAPPQCPASSEMGRVEFVTPLFPGQTLTGKVYFGTPRPGVPLVNYISVEDPRLRLKLGGYATIDPTTTAITAHFLDQPQVPFQSFEFVYTDPGDGRATLTSPTACGDYGVTADMTPWNGGGVQSPSNTFKVVDCPPPAFAPQLGVSVADAQAGGPAALTVHIGRPDKDLRLQDAKVSLPPGLTGRLPNVPQCDVAAARAASCPDASLVGHASVAVGTGPAPLTLPGKVYLTQGFDGGIAGLAVVVDTKVPALDLGTVVVMNRLVLRPDTGIDVQTEALPQTLQGIPTVYRAIDLTIDRAGFMQNATSCAPQTVGGAFTAVGGATAAATAPYQATGCDKLPFAPKLAASFGAKGQTAKGSHPPLTVTIQQADGQAAMSRTVVSLPAGLGVDLKNLSAVCTDDQLNAGACPAGSKIGTVSASTPLLPVPLSGGAYLTQGAKPGALPGIALDLGLIRLKGDVALGTRVTTTFDGIPDVPLAKLTLSLTGGPKGALSTIKDLCTTTPTVEAQYGAHSGATGKETVKADVVGCAASASKPLTVKGKLAGVKRKRPSLSLTVTSTKALRGVRVKLPAALKLSSSKTLKKSARVTLGGKRYKKTSVRWSSGKVSFTAAKGKTTKKLVLSLPRGVLKLKKAMKVGSKQAFTVYGLTSAGKLVHVTVKLTAGR
ncbi:MAG TPA: hypothetical protein VFG42_10990 [Baekduia sp.]|uniref:hypothetical protein n=1 Tax=Baekduia sp. TaxID=2600305 RepID=UPI002D7827E4|nr:hypothetical protein [Baekduia sp.]HET6507303.1 hypothetical protein [Baekduia sp.]